MSMAKLSRLGTGNGLPLLCAVVVAEWGEPPVEEGDILLRIGAVADVVSKQAIRGSELQGPPKFGELRPNRYRSARLFEAFLVLMLLLFEKGL